ncbi:MAG: tetratricopeptide repeat protein [Pseudoxanthomonas sp.]
MFRKWVSVGLLGWAVLTPAWARQEQKPPPEWASYLAAANNAEQANQDPEQRCLAYPDLPGTDWLAGAAKARCPLLRQPMLSLEQMEALLDEPDGAAKLDKRFSDLLDAHYKDTSQREQITVTYWVFNADEKPLKIAKRWLQAAPGSVFAKTALGYVYARQGWKARGTRLVSETPESNLQRMNERFAAAVPLLAQAIETEKRMLPACVELASIGRMSSDRLHESAMAACMKADPFSYFVVEQAITAAEPRWGGSDAAMRAMTAYAAAHVDKNPMLNVFLGSAAGEREDLGDDWKLILPGAVAATLQAPNAHYISRAGHAYRAQQDKWAAVAYLSQALRFRPRDADDLRLRAGLLNDLGYDDWALPDARLAVALEPEDGGHEYQLGRSLLFVEGELAARPHFERAMKDPGSRQRAYEMWCQTFVTTKDWKQADSCSAELTEEYPDNAEGWRLRAFALNALRNPMVSKAMQEFLDHQDLKRWPFHKATAEKFKVILESRPDPARAKSL